MNSTYRRLLLALVGGFVSFCAATPATAETVLLFSRQFGVSSETTLSSTDLLTYGDRVIAPLQGPSNFKYGGAANTPNIVVDYSADERTWPSSYGDLQYVLYSSNFSPNDKTIKLTLTADPGYQVVLNSFDLGGYSQTDYITNSVKIFNSLEQLVYNQSNVLVQGDANGPQHTSLTFSGLQSQRLRIEIDASNITTGFGAENVGLDNVSFSQVTAIPEPTTYGAGLLVLGAFYLVRRAKRARML